MTKTMKMRELCDAAGVEFIRTRGNRAMIRVGDGLGGEVKLVSKLWLENAIEELEALTQASNQPLKWH